MSKIEWTHRPGTKSEVWNPVQGCSLESQGCANCYAMTFAHRFSGPGAPFEGLTKKTNSGVKWNGNIRLVTEALHKPLSWKTPRTCFVNSMSDLFHEKVPFDFIDNVFAVMDCCPQHTFIILTKRSKRMKQYFDEKREWHVSQLKYAYKSDDADLSAWPLKNVWMGVSVENQEKADERIPDLLRIPSEIRFLSCEPLIGPISLDKCIHLLNWVIVGGESGHNASPMHPDWVRDLRNECRSHNVPFFFKQWGEFRPFEESYPPFYRDCAIGIEVDGHFMNFIDYNHKSEAGKYNGFRWMPAMESITYCLEHKSSNCSWLRMGKKESGNFLDGVQHLEFPK